MFFQKQFWLHFHVDMAWEKARESVQKNWRDNEAHPDETYEWLEGADWLLPGIRLTGTGENENLTSTHENRAQEVMTEHETDKIKSKLR